MVKQLTGRLPVQGIRILLWDMIIAEETNIRPYLNFIKDKEMVINVARHSCIAIKEGLDRKPTDTTRNTIKFVNTLSEEELRTMGVKDIIVVITWAR